MKIKTAFYCSGTASRVLKFYEHFSYSKYESKFVLYDGDNKNTILSLQAIFGKANVYTYLYRGELSRRDNSISLSNMLLDLLKSERIDYLFCFGSSILRGDIVEVYENRIINFHPSILPSFPGLNAIDQALDSNTKLLGNTAHFIDKGIDTGPIIMQTVIARDAFTDYESVLGLQIEMLKRIWDLLSDNSIEVSNGRVILRDYNKSYFSSI